MLYVHSMHMGEKEEFDMRTKVIELIRLWLSM